MTYPNAPADDPGYPRPTYQDGVLATPGTQAEVTPLITAGEQAQIDALYLVLKPKAIAEGREYMLAHTPATPGWQDAMILKIATDFPPPADDPEPLP